MKAAAANSAPEITLIDDEEAASRIAAAPSDPARQLLEQRRGRARRSTPELEAVRRSVPVAVHQGHPVNRVGRETLTIWQRQVPDYLDSD